MANFYEVLDQLADSISTKFLIRYRAVSFNQNLYVASFQNPKKFLENKQYLPFLRK
jgi:hypothetical protein